MRRQSLILFIIILIILSSGAIILLREKTPKKSDVLLLQQNNAENIITNMKITSSAFADKQNIPSKYTCDGENINPPLSISNVPLKTKSLVLIVDDPDAPAGVWTHWTLWNIPPDSQIIPEGSEPSSAVQGKTSFGTNKYGGPCPPSGTHHYYFKLYALDSVLNLPEKTDSDNLQKAMSGHVIEQTQLVGLYSR
jgi:Raf kinase inhibitor-like YbhB/YbcL family protein